MRRIRIALALVSLATLGLVALLAWRASQGLAAERAVRHEAVAERAFEEMERALTDFLAREEARPFEHYAPTLPASGERSPLAGGLEPFVVGAFQWGPDGALTTPLDPADARDARVRRVVKGLWSANEARALADADATARPDAGASQRVDEKLGKKEALAGEERAAGSGDARQAPGTTRVVSGPGVAFRDEREGAGADAPAQPRAARNAFDVLESLNRAADDRAERKQKVARAPKAAVYGTSERYEAEAEVQAEAAEPAPAPAAPPAEAPATAALRSLGSVREASPASSREGDAVRVALDPMVGVASGDDLVLYRTVLAARRAWRQGLVLDRAMLADWLEERVIRESGLAPVASVHFEDPVRPIGSDRYVFAHRFAEPFDALHARLALASLPGVASPGALYGLVALLLAVGTAGLVAVHRTVSVTVSYAERRSNFVAAVTHELRTPLTAIRMYAEMLRDGLVPGDDKRREYYATITDESERLSRLVDNVLEFSKLEGGRRELQVTVGAVGPVLAEAAEKLSAHAAREGFAIAVDVAPDLPAVRFDRDALLQVLFNLVDNATKYAKTSERRSIRLEARREGDAVAVAVRDFGPGVRRGHQERVFEPFYRGESELTRTTQGTGIGLALVKELAERMGAAVSGANAEGGGFRVRLAFPCP